MKRHSSMFALTVFAAVLSALAEPTRFGYRPHPNPIQRVKPALAKTAQSWQQPKKSSLPERCDLRDTGFLSPVRDQAPWGTCWTFSTMACLEFQLRRGEGSYDADFSENNLANLHGYAGGYNSGGNNMMACAVLLREEAPVTEKLDPYSSVGTSVRERGVRIPRKVLFLPQRTTVEDGPTFEAEINKLKEAVSNYGAISVSYSHQDEFYNADSYGYYCNDDNYQYEINHAVTLVGWDDGYPAYNFRTEPPSDGAFIVRNSWGTDWGDGGYFYVSYYDTTFAFDEDNCVWLDLTDGSDYGHLYQHDPLGYVAQYGYEDFSATAANVFTARDDERIAAFGIYALTDDTTYTASLVVNPIFKGNQLLGTTVAKASGTIDIAGYRVIDFGAKPSIGAGTNFAIVVSLKSWTYYPIAFSCNSENYTTGIVARAGASYIRYTDDDEWEDLSAAGCYFCAKVYADVKDTQKTATGEVDVPRKWIRNYAGSEVANSHSLLSDYFYGSFDAIAEHVASNGLTVAESYARGLDPDAIGQTNLVATIEFKDGKPVIDVIPCNTNLWNYETRGTSDLKNWHTRTEGDTCFKVRVTEKK